MADRFHIIITGEDGRSSSFQFSRKKTLLTAAACLAVIFSALFVTLSGGGSLFTNRHLNEMVSELQTELSHKEQAATLYEKQIARLEQSKQVQIESLKKEYEYKLNNQKVYYDLENTNLQLENVKLMNSAISDLHARSEMIESVMTNIGVEIIKSAPESPENSGGPFIPVAEPSYDDLLKKVDTYLRTIEYMPLGKPVYGAITSKYGQRTDPLNNKQGFHVGVDIRGKHGTKIRATAAGVVVKAFRNGGYGNYVEIDHGNGYRTAYGHMQSYVVKEGESVTRGQIIGLVGSSGRSLGPHLHYEIRLHRRPVNPAKFMQVADLSHTLSSAVNTDVQN
ncbi:MAG: M23 family metallopeptidase [Desulfofustis sp.]|jgi:murein DD-endopeptidase MepM/ murein hydrolase activator NlpD